MWFNTEPRLRFNGIYRTRRGSEFCWLRFYPDGIVVKSWDTTDDDAHAVAKWLHKDTRKKTLLEGDDMLLIRLQVFSLYLPTGSYTIVGARVEISIQYPKRLEKLSHWEYQIGYTTINYKGTIYKDEVKIHSIEDSSDYLYEYKFVKVAVPTSKEPRKEAITFRPDKYGFDRTVVVHITPIR